MLKKIMLMSFSLFVFNLEAHAAFDCPLKFEEAQMCAEIQWVSGPHVGKKSEFNLTFWHSGDPYREPMTPPFDFKVYAWMLMDNGHNHGGPKMTLEYVKEGQYVVRDARFFMGHMKGHWEVRIDQLNNDGSVLVTRGEKVEL